MMNDIGIDKNQERYIIKKMINIAIRATYYIFCCRNRNWDSPDLMQFWFCFVFVLFCFFLFNNPISSSICKLPIRSEIYNCTFKNTIKFPLLILLLLLQEDSKQTTETASFLASHYNPWGFAWGFAWGAFHLITVELPALNDYLPPSHISPFDNQTYAWSQL